MKQLTLVLTDIHKHGFLRAAIIESIKTHQMRNPHDIADALNMTHRAIDTEMRGLHKLKVIEYIDNGNGRKLGFIL